jgi:predicted nucleic acid-binding protein
VYISAVNLVEIYYGYIRELGKDAALEILARIYAAPIEIVEAIPEPVYLEASRLKGAYKISLADAFGLATAFHLSGSFVTSDGEIKPVDAAEPVTVLWFRPPKEKQAK